MFAHLPYFGSFSRVFVFVRQIFITLEGFFAVSDLRVVLFGRISCDRLQRGHFVGACAVGNTWCQATFRACNTDR